MTPDTLPLDSAVEALDRVIGLRRVRAHLAMLHTVSLAVITQACDGWDQAPTALRMVPNGLWPARRAVSTTVRIAASPSAAHLVR